MSVTLPNAYYKFDEASGNAADATGGGNTLTNNGGATFGAGALNNAATLATASSQYFSHVDAAAFQASSSFSVSMWFNLTTLPGSGDWSIVSKYGTTGQAVFIVEFGVQPNGIYILYSKDGTVPNASIQEWDSAASILPATGSWHHLAIIVDAANNAVTVYIDNVPKTMTARAGEAGALTLFNGTSPFAIGALAGGTPARFANMGVDEVGWWKNYKLTSGEVTSLYNSGTPLPYSSFQPAAKLTPPNFVGQAINRASTY